jgi:hypothetical protein
MKLSYLLMTTVLFTAMYSAHNDYATTSVVTVVGAVISSQEQEKDKVDTKYKRKDCPVCKGKGWYMSGDGIKKIECQYCEPEQEQQSTKPYIIRR